MMNDVQEEHLSRGVSATQVKKAAYHIRYFLGWVLFACFYNIVVYYFYFGTLSIYYNNWLLIFSSILVACLAGTYSISKSKSMSTFNLDTLLQLICLIIGVCLSIGVYVINQLLPIENTQINDVHKIVFSGLMLSIIYLLAIVYLAERLRYFLLIFIPSAFPVVFSNLLFLNQTPDVYNIIFDAWFTVIFICALLTHKIFLKMNLLNQHNKAYLDKSNQHLEDSAQLQNQLQKEIEKSKNIENQLQLNNQLLEQKVKERTYDINKIKDRLENHQANLDFAHETAGIHSWLWNIEKRTVELSGLKSGIQVIQYENANDQLNLFIHPDDQPHYNRLLRLHLRGETERFEATYRTKKNSEWCWIKDIGKVISRDPDTYRPLRMVGIHRDIEQEKKDQEKLKLAANVFQQVAQGVFVLDNNFCFLEVNPYFCQLIGMPADKILSKHMFEITTNTRFDMRERHKDITHKVLIDGSYDAEVTEDFISGKTLTLWLHINALKDDNNRVLNYVGVISDLTERKENEQRVAYLENYDLLTDLPNRIYFNLQLQQYLMNKSKPLNHFSIIRLNIDRFRHFNEFLNHQAGDDVLRQVSKRLKSVCSDALLIAYLNNNDFALIYNLSLSRPPIHHTVDLILKAFKDPFIIQSQEHNISVSMGIAIYPEHGRQIGSLNSHAEIALAEAKKLGGNTTYFYDNKQDSIFESDIELERGLKQALKKNELEIYYQAKISNPSMELYGFEALIRWNHPKYGIITPNRFLPIAEVTSLISDIGQFVIFQTCKQIQAWQQLGYSNIKVSINVVAQQILRGELLHHLDKALTLYHLKPESIELELTESSLLDKSDHVIELLHQIKQKNIKIALDDFGTGYSSLAYLADYPIDTLKIDRAFVSKIGQTKDNAIVHAIIAMGKAMGMKLVAEGVENIEQIRYLRDQGCDYFQGYYFSKPLNAADTTLYIAKQKMDRPSN